jgi:hypothetical protein
MKTLTKKLRAASLSLAPGFSPVTSAVTPTAASAAFGRHRKAAKAAAIAPGLNTGLKPGANESGKVENTF